MPTSNTTQRSLAIFSTCPASNRCDQDTYFERVVNVSRWSEQAGCTGILVYTDNGLVDPWLIAQAIVENTTSICPLVAVQPMYMHPFSVAKMISTIGWLYGRRLWINMVAGGFKNDLNSLDDPTPHDMRYDRLVEYTTIVKRLLEDPSPLTFAGEFYKVNQLVLNPPLSPDLMPGITLSGSSEAGFSAAQALEAVAVQYPGPSEQYEAEPLGPEANHGVRVGIIARQDEDQAWQVAHERFPVDRKGQLTQELAMKVSDSVWHHQLSEMGESLKGKRDPYWLVPFQNYKTFCPYLVGSYDQVANELGRYMRAGYRTFILDIPASEEELEHIGVVFERAQEQAV